MSWRTVVITSSAKLDYQLGFLVIRKEDIIKIHLSEIAILILESTAVSMTAALLCELSKKKIKVIFCDTKRNPYGELMPYYGSHDSSAKLRQQIEWKKDIKTAVWTEIVAEKIRKQAELLEYLEKEEASKLHTYADNVEFGDSSNREGHAAKVYFNALFGMDFTRTAENSLNAALNYGYSILLSAFNREIVACGYLTQLGLFHDNMFNPYNLASDLMEIFRPIVDKVVVDMKPEQFEHCEKMEVLKFLQYEVVIAGRKEMVSNAIKIYCHSVFDAINDMDTSLIKFYRNEL